MTKSIAGRTEIRLIAPILVITALIFPLMTIEAQRGKRKQERANQQKQTTNSTQSNSTQQSGTDQGQRAGGGRRGRRGSTGAQPNQQQTNSTQSTSTQQSGTDQGQRAGTSRRGRRGSTGGTKASSNTTAQPGNSTVTVVRQLNQAQLSAAAIKTISSMSVLRGVVAVRGTSISPLTGSSLWLLSNGGYALIGGSTVEPLASETYPKDMGDGDMYYATCYCPGFDPNKNDGCEFDGLANPQNCKQKGGVNCTCKFTDMVIFGTGAQEILNG